MLYTLATESVQHRKRCYTLWPQKVYNIENDVIHFGHRKWITSKTMLYTSALKLDNIVFDVIQFGHRKWITSKTMLYTIA